MTTSPRQAAELVDATNAVRRRLRRSLGRPWFPMVTFGLVAVAVAALVAMLGPAAFGPAWAVGAPVGLALTARHYRRRAHRTGVAGRADRIWPVAVAMSVACLAAGYVGALLGGTTLALALPVAVAWVGYLALGWVQREPLGPVCAAPAVAAGLVLALDHRAPWLVELCFGLLLVAGGAALRAVEQRDARAASR